MQTLKALLIALVVIGYPVLMHLLLTNGGWPLLTLLLALGPFALLPVTLAGAGYRLLAAASAAALAVASTLSWPILLQRQDLIYLLQNVGMQCLMAGVFGHGLLPGREPLIAQLARRIHRDDYSPEIARYARQATWGWTFYFLVMGLASVLIFMLAPLATWSWFVNFISFGTLGAMFAAEYGMRRWRLRHIRHIGFLEGIRLYWQRDAQSDGAPRAP